MKNVNKFTRAGHGKYIVCPECMHTDKVYHFAWSGLSCSYCEKIINKYDWLIREEETEEKLRQKDLRQHRMYQDEDLNYTGNR